MKIKINQLDDEVNEKNVKMQQLKTKNNQLHHQLVIHQKPTSVNKISVGCQTRKVSIIVTGIKVYYVSSTTTGKQCHRILKLLYQIWR